MPIIDGSEVVFRHGTKDEYESAQKEDGTLYYIEDTGEIYVGNDKYGIDDSSVRVVEQTFSDLEKSQARQNIGAVSSEELLVINKTLYDATETTRNLFDSLQYKNLSYAVKSFPVCNFVSNSASICYYVLANSNSSYTLSKPRSLRPTYISTSTSMPSVGGIVINPVDITQLTEKTVDLTIGEYLVIFTLPAEDVSMWQVEVGESATPFIQHTTAFDIVSRERLSSVENELLKPKTTEYIVSNQSIMEIEPNKFYDFGLVADLDISLATPENTNVVNEYMFQFNSGNVPTQLTLPQDVKWTQELVIEANMTYQVNILNNLAVYVCA